MENKKIAVLFEIPRGTQEQYDASTKKLKEAGVTTVKGLLYHVAGPAEKGWHRLKNGWYLEDFWGF